MITKTGRSETGNCQTGVDAFPVSFSYHGIMVFDLLSSGKREPALKNTVDDSDRANDDQHEKPPP